METDQDVTGLEVSVIRLVRALNRSGNDLGEDFTEVGSRAVGYFGPACNVGERASPSASPGLPT
jgi:hypothetical protein